MTIAESRFKLALDLGTTTLAGSLVNVAGEVVATSSMANPQQELGADILLRLQQAHEGYGLRLQTLLLEGVRALIAQLTSQADCRSNQILSAAAAGNPGVCCLLQNLPVASLLFPPHKPPYRQLRSLPAVEIDAGLRVPLEVFPLVSGFVGGDLVACLLSCGEVPPGTLLVDIGTNGELACWDGDRWWASSAAAGPAFEGGNIGTGMVLKPGAVTNVTLDGDRFELTVAGKVPPRGLCGSGLAALVAVARDGGLIDATGRICSPGEVPNNLARYLVECERGMAICFYRDACTELCLTQQDLRNFQLAKGALKAGVEVLLERAGFAPQEVPRVLVTGALGTALPLAVLKRVALLPEPMIDKTLFVSNGVLAGLQYYLMAANGRSELDHLLSRIQPLPLSGTPAFETRFLAALNF